MKKLALHCLALAAALYAPALQASIICVAPTQGTPGSLTITAPITFTITANDTVSLFDFKAWVTYDGQQNSSRLSTPLQYSLNGVAAAYTSYLIDNTAGLTSSVQANDGFLFFDAAHGPTVKSGDTLTLLAATYTLVATNDFNPQTTQAFNGYLFVCGQGANQISDLVAAPEPSTWSLLGLGAVGMAVVTLRRRSATRIGAK